MSAGPSLALLGRAVSEPEEHMRFYIAGGVGDQGRNCFYVQGERHAFLMDAGTSTDGMDRVPDLTLEQIRSADYLFVTHSHRDHTGAIHFLEENGFTGQVLMSNQTYRQIHHKPLNTMILDSTAPELELSTDFRVIWGRTGHCAGAVWFLIEIEGKKLFFSGDYREGDPFYRCDEVRGMKADLAVVDAAYSREDRRSEMREEVMKTVEEMVKDNHPLLLPVPHYGRGLSIAVLIHQRLGDAHPVYMSPKLYDEWLNLAHRKYFARDAVLDMPYSVFKAWDEEHVEEGGIYLLTDAQLAKSYSRHLADENPDMGILLTGSVHGYGRAGEYLSEGRAKFTLWPNHLTRREMQDFKESNYFSIVVPFHNPKEEADADTFIF